MKQVVWIIASPLFLLLVIGCNKNEISKYQHEYQLHVEDLSFISENGYKDNFADIDLQATLRYTGVALDCAINGNGFFCYSDSNSTHFLYSRDGALHIDNEGYLINKDNYYLEPRIQLPLDLSIDRIFVKQDGSITYIQEERTLGQIHIYNRTDDEYVKRGNYFIFESVEEIQDSKIISKTLEMSNYSLRSKLYRMLEILFLLKSIDSRHSDYYDFRIYLIDELLISFRESKRNMIQVFYREVEETVKFLSFQSLKVF
ncbi:flagellar hook basal-body protein [Spirochaeta cellobiosiphila]|uniref:flagellar hook basal-body protein n=1 Tax=Spirochaeta cellobiosiphila TaxID=504483 RepID=UPI0004115CBB|nr:flagellar hook basal-body protein [Spirochaeta cellobiosiphila]